MNKQKALEKIEELKKFVEDLDKQQEWVKIDYSVIPKELFDKYGIKPFEIMKRKMSFIQFLHNGKKKALAGGPMLIKDDSELVAFVERLNSDMGMEVEVKIEEEIDELS